MSSVYSHPMEIQNLILKGINLFSQQQLWNFCFQQPPLLSSESVENALYLPCLFSSLSSVIHVIQHIIGT